MMSFASPENYGGPLPLFPLPSVVFFPNTYLSLHVFEPRYLQMVQDALEKDALIGIVLLKPGWEKDYYGNPPVYETACMGQMMKVEALPDGRFNILLRGMGRVKIRGFQQTTPYRTARVEVVRDEPHTLHPRSVIRFRREIFEALSHVLEPPLWGYSVMSAPHLEVGTLVDMIAYSLPLELPVKQRILEMPEARPRVELLLRVLGEAEGKGERVRVRQLPFLHELARN